MEYYKRNLFPGFVLLLKRGTYEAKRKPGLKSNLAIVRMLSTLAAYHISEGLKTCASGDTKGREFLEEATEIINDAEKVSSAFSPELSIRKGKHRLNGEVFLIFIIRSPSAGQECCRFRWISIQILLGA